jgi:hypothetical protein
MATSGAGARRAGAAPSACASAPSPWCCAASDADDEAPSASGEPRSCALAASSSAPLSSTPAASSRAAGLQRASPTCIVPALRVRRICCGAHARCAAGAHTRARACNTGRLTRRAQTTHGWEVFATRARAREASGRSGVL